MRLKNLLPLIGIIIFVVILFTLDLNEIFRIFASINPLHVFLSFFLVIPLLLLINVEWQLLLKRQKIYVSYWYCIKNSFIGFFFASVIPGGFGGYTRALYLSDESGTPLLKCFSNLVLLNTIEYVAMLVLGFIAAIFLISVYPYLFVIILGVIFLVIILYIFFFKSDRSRSFFKKMVSSSIFSGLKGRLEGSIDSFYEDLPRFKDVIIPFSLSLLGFSIKNIMLFFVAKLFSIDIPFMYFFLIIAVADVIINIPISIYGFGTREVAWITMFSVTKFTNGVIISPEQIVSFSLFWFVIMWLVPSTIGGFVTLYETRRTKLIIKNTEN